MSQANKSEDYLTELFELIQEHEDIDSLITEMNEYDDDAKYNSSVLSQPSFMGLISLVEQHHHLTSSKMSTSSALVLSNALKKIVAVQSPLLFIGNKTQKTNVEVILKACKHFMNKKQFSVNNFAKNLSKESGDHLPFEVIWMLHAEEVMTLNLFFISNLKQPKVINSISDNVYMLCGPHQRDLNVNNTCNSSDTDATGKVYKKSNDVGVTGKMADGDDKGSGSDGDDKGGGGDGDDKGDGGGDGDDKGGGNDNDHEGEGINYRKKILMDVMSSLLKFTFNPNPDNDDVTSRGLKNVSSALLDNITRKLLNNTHVKFDINLYDVIQSMSKMPNVGRYNQYINVDVINRYFRRQLSIILTKPAHQSFMDLKIFSDVSSSQFNRININTRCLFEKLLDGMPAADTFEIFKKVLEQKEFNWSNGIIIITIALVCCHGFISLVTDFAEELLRRSMESYDMDDLTSSMLIYRLCCVQGEHVFMSYSTCFVKHLKDHPMISSNRRAFVFFVKLLTDIVPYECAIYIKTHIQNAPTASMKYRDVWMDYVTLAKTHLLDINTAGKDEREANRTNIEMLNKLESDVENILMSFEKESKIPSSVLELSLFNKPFFLNQFLPSLLKPRFLPSIPDTRMKFISLLLKSGKLPNNMYDEYELQCKKMTQQLIEGVMDCEDDDDEDEMMSLQLSLLDQLKHTLDVLQDCIVKQNCTNISRHLSNLSEKLEIIEAKNKSSSSAAAVATKIADIASKIKKTDDGDGGDGDVDDGAGCGGKFCEGINKLMDVTHSSRDNPSVTQTSHCILEFVLKTASSDNNNINSDDNVLLTTPMTASNSTTTTTNTTINTDWLNQLIQMLSSNHEKILKTVYALVAHIFVNGLFVVSSCHYTGLALILEHSLRNADQLFDKEVFQICNEYTCKYVINRINIKSIKELNSVLDFILEYVDLIEMMYNEFTVIDDVNNVVKLGGGAQKKGLIPGKFLEIVWFAAPRLYTETKPLICKKFDSFEMSSFSKKDDLYIYNNNDGEYIHKLARIKRIFSKDSPFYRENLMSFKKWMNQELILNDNSSANSSLINYYEFIISSRRFPPSDAGVDGGRGYLEHYCMDIVDVLLEFNERRDGCCECIQLQSNQLKVNCFIQLIQRLTWKMSLEIQSEPWFWSATTKHLNFNDLRKNNPLNTAAETFDRKTGTTFNDTVNIKTFSNYSIVTRIVNMILGLPSSLLFSNVCCQDVSTLNPCFKKGLNCLTDFINLKLLNFKESHIIDLNFVIHVVDGFKNLPLEHINVVFTFLQNSPLFLISFLQYWGSVGPILNYQFNERHIAKELFTTFDEMMHKQRTKYPSDESSIATLCEFLGLIDTNSTRESAQFVIYTLGICIEFIKIFKSAISQTPCDNFEKVINRLKNKPELIISCQNSFFNEPFKGITSKIVPERFIHLWPCIITSMYVHLKNATKDRKNLFLSENFLNGFLRSYIDYDHLFNSSTVDLPFLYQCPFVDIFSCSQAAGETLRDLPKECLIGIDRNIYEKLNINLKIIISNRT